MTAFRIFDAANSQHYKPLCCSFEAWKWSWATVITIQVGFSCDLKFVARLLFSCKRGSTLLFGCLCLAKLYLKREDSWTWRWANGGFKSLRSHPIPDLNEQIKVQRNSLCAPCDMDGHAINSRQIRQNSVWTRPFRVGSLEHKMYLPRPKLGPHIQRRRMLTSVSGFLVNDDSDNN